jgi:hypothetical protein
MILIANVIYINFILLVTYVYFGILPKSITMFFHLPFSFNEFISLIVFYFIILFSIVKFFQIIFNREINIQKKYVLLSFILIPFSLMLMKLIYYFHVKGDLIKKVYPFLHILGGKSDFSYQYHTISPDRLLPPNPEEISYTLTMPTKLLIVSVLLLTLAGAGYLAYTLFYSSTASVAIESTSIVATESTSTALVVVPSVIPLPVKAIVAILATRAYKQLFFPDNVDNIITNRWDRLAVIVRESNWEMLTKMIKVYKAGDRITVTDLEIILQYFIDKKFLNPYGNKTKTELFCEVLEIIYTFPFIASSLYSEIYHLFFN